MLGLIAVAIAGGAWVSHAISVWKLNAKNARFLEDVENLFVGLQQFKEVVGSYPAGNNAEIVRALGGQNSKNVIILVGRKKDLNSKGELVDPWGVPLRIYFSGVGILVRSAGPNKRFDDSTALNGDDFFRSN
jgi:hypothetical protein